jgi:hypothetical protein
MVDALLAQVTQAVELAHRLAGVAFGWAGADQHMRSRFS